MGNKASNRNSIFKAQPIASFFSPDIAFTVIMQLSYASLLALAATIVTATPLTTRSQPGWEFPESMPLAARQATPEPGTPLYLCHENCGTSITLAREEGYCTNWQWIARFDACLLCANEHDIWQFYGTSVTRSATACGLTATPAKL